MISVGVDVHKIFCQACLKDEHGTILDEFRFRNNREGGHKLAAILKKHGEAKVNTSIIQERELYKDFYWCGRRGVFPIGYA